MLATTWVRPEAGCDACSLPQNNIEQGANRWS